MTTHIDMDSRSFLDALYRNGFRKLRKEACRYYIVCDAHADVSRRPGGDTRCAQCRVVDALEGLHAAEMRAWENGSRNGSSLPLDGVNEALERLLEGAR